MTLLFFISGTASTANLFSELLFSDDPFSRDVLFWDDDENDESTRMMMSSVGVFLGEFCYCTDNLISFMFGYYTPKNKTK